MTWATPFGSEVAQVRSPGSLHNRWCCDPELKPPLHFSFDALGGECPSKHPPAAPLRRSAVCLLGIAMLADRCTRPCRA
ncbi:hypothetical protein BRL93_13285 [Xanthomonas oryzae pv. oryzae]|nr:hypothetical protein BRL93_13285 [Xanthomonas oryzae pv. oryzae]